MIVNFGGGFFCGVQPRTITRRFVVCLKIGDAGKEATLETGGN